MPEVARPEAPSMVFGQTSWTVVFRAAHGGEQEALEALDLLARRYRGPLYSFCLRQGDSPENAEDYVQGLFEKLLRGQELKAANPERGRFRNWILSVLQQHRYQEYRRANAQRRRPEAGFEPMGIDGIEEPAVESAQLGTDRVFMQEWARETLQHAKNLLRRNYAARGLEHRFDLMWTHIVPGHGGNHAELAAALKMKPASLSDALSNLRAEFRDVLRHVVREGLDEDDDVDAEIRDLMGAFA